MSPKVAPNLHAAVVAVQAMPPLPKRDLRRSRRARDRRVLLVVLLVEVGLPVCRPHWAGFPAWSRPPCLARRPGAGTVMAVPHDSPRRLALAQVGDGREVAFLMSASVVAGPPGGLIPPPLMPPPGSARASSAGLLFHLKVLSASRITHWWSPRRLSASACNVLRAGSGRHFFPRKPSSPAWCGGEGALRVKGYQCAT